MYNVYVYELFYSNATLELLRSLSNDTLSSEIVADIVRMSIESKYWDIISHINDFNLDDFELNDCDFTYYSLVELKKFKKLTFMNPPEYLFNKLMIEQPESEQELINFFGEHCLNSFYTYLLEEIDQYYNIIKKLIKSNKFPLFIINLENFCNLVYYTFPESDFFMNLALEKYNNIFYNHFLDFLIKNYSCKNNLYIYLINKEAQNTIKPNLKEFEKYTNNTDFLNLLKKL